MDRAFSITPPNEVNIGDLIDLWIDHANVTCIVSNKEAIQYSHNNEKWYWRLSLDYYGREEFATWSLKEQRWRWIIT